MTKAESMSEAMREHKLYWFCAVKAAKYAWNGNPGFAAEWRSLGFSARDRRDALRAER